MDTKNYFLIIVALLVASCPLVAAAAIYKWVDENGVTQFSEKKPVGYESKNIQVAPPPPDEVVKEAQERQRKLIDAQNKSYKAKKAREKEQQKRKEEEREKHKAECDYLRSRIAQLRLPGVFSTPIDDGGILVVTGNRKNVLIAELEKTMKEMKCH